MSSSGLHSPGRTGTGFPEPPSLEIFKTQLDVVLSNLFLLTLALSTGVGLDDLQICCKRQQFCEQQMFLRFSHCCGKVTRRYWLQNESYTLLFRLWEVLILVYYYFKGSWSRRMSSMEKPETFCDSHNRFINLATE